MSLRQRIRERQEQLGIQPKKSLGQNFLVSDHVVEKIIRAATEFAPKTLIEVGPGLGSLTDSLISIADDLRLIELDRVFAEHWRSRGLQVIEEDALRWQWNLAGMKRPCILVSNLPYQISSSLVVDRSIDEQGLDGMILMFQKEVAQRLQAKHGTEAYGFLSVLAQVFWSIDLLLEAGPRDFDPPPRVASRVLVFNPRQVQLTDRKRFLRFMKACFLHPRKLLASNLVEGWGRPRDQVNSLLAASSLEPQVRAEQLRVQDFLDLYRRFDQDVPS